MDTSSVDSETPPIVGAPTQDTLSFDVGHIQANSFLMKVAVFNSSQMTI